MIAKCNYCGKSFDAKRNTARFCSDLHRTLFGKLSQDEKTKRFIEYIGSISTADKVPVPEDKTDNLDKQLRKEEIADFENRELGERLNTFCKQHRTSPDDLFSFLMDNYGKKSKTSKIEEKAPKNAERPSISNWREQQIKRKCGIGG